MHADPHELRYCVTTPAERSSRAGAATVAGLFRLWDSVWSDEYRRLGHTPAPRADDFHQHDLVCGLWHRGQPISVHLYSFYDLRSPLALQRPFVRAYLDAAALGYCRARGYQVLMSLEGLAVAPGFRRNEFGIAAAELTARLGLKLFAGTHADAAIACTRNSRKLNLLGPALGFERIRENFTVHGEPSDLFVGAEAISPVRGADPIVRAALERLWHARTDLREGTPDATVRLGRTAA